MDTRGRRGRQPNTDAEQLILTLAVRVLMARRAQEIDRNARVEEGTERKGRRRKWQGN